MRKVHAETFDHNMLCLYVGLTFLCTEGVYSDNLGQSDP